MKTFRYKGLSSGGAEIEGIIEAFDKNDAVNKARENCRILTSVEPAGSSKLDAVMNADIGSLLSGGKIKPKKLALLCSELGIELKAGLPLVRSLRLASENEEDKNIRRMLAEVADDVQGGNGLADSFALRCPGMPKTFIETIRAGENSGKMDECFDHLKAYYEDSAAVGSKVKSALVYPVMLIIVAIAVVAIIMIKAVPVFESSFGAVESLPGVTRALIGISHFFTNNILIIIAAVAALVLAIRMFGKTDRGMHLYGKLAMTFPGIGLVNRMNAACQFASTMNTMLTAGLPLVNAARLTAQVVDNILVSEDISTAVEGVIEGNTLGSGLSKSKWLPRMLVEMTSVGEETGNMTDTLTVVNEYYSKEVTAAVGTALGIMEPVIILVMAAIVVFILLSVYLPLFSMYGSI